MEAEKWGRRIRAFRKLKGYTQQSFANALGVSIAIIGEIERGNRVPSKEIIQQITEKLNISIEELSPLDKNES
ncbi:helix-turn-helix domain-containing protein [Bacillus sp. 03113]|uniref:helix-turn-helix domain-containing protein n=1 Tax=Bacillus sp. 03113 TaxID=2578211 RepID=UPI00114371C3|nr:helix-turn-helix transcriptional regulator [Bacillus sp. 03113]